jgi:transcriptional regulator
MARAASPLDLLQGTLDLLILKTLSWGPAQGYAVARWIQQLTGEVLTVGEGSLYPALHRLEERGWIESEWQLSEHNRRAKFYHLTAQGRQQLRNETATWGKFVDAVAKVLAATSQPV